MKKTFIASLLAACSLVASAADYFVVVPVAGKTQSVSAIQVGLNQSSLPAAQLGTVYNYDFKQNLQVTGDAAYTGTGASWVLSSGSLPAGISLDANTGVLSGTPTTVGTSSFGLTATYKTKSGVQGYQVVANAALAVSLASATVPNAIVRNPFSYSFLPNLAVTGDANYSAGTGVSWRVASGTLPTGLTLGSATGVLSGTATEFSNSGTTFTVEATYKTKTAQRDYTVYPADGSWGSVGYLLSFDGNLNSAKGAAAVPTSPTYAPGFAGQGFDLSTGGFASIPTSAIAPSSLMTVSSTFTVEYWLKRTGTFAGGAYDVGHGFGEFQPQGGSNAWSFGLDPANKLQVYTWTGAAQHLRGGTTIALNTWTHVALSVNNGTAKIFVNGVLDGTGAMSTPNQSIAYAIGGWFGVKPPFIMDELRVTPGVARYSANFQVPEGPFPTR